MSEHKERKLYDDEDEAWAMRLTVEEEGVAAVA